MRIDIKGVIVPNDDKWIYDWLNLDSTCPKDIQNAIAKSNVENIKVYLDSGGGDIFAGSNIYASLKEIAERVTIHVIGLAASAASVIMCAAKSDIVPTAMVMAHNVSASAHGDYHDFDKQSQVLQKANKAIASAYTSKTGMTEGEALAMMDKETWLTAEEAVNIGLIDSVRDANTQTVANIGSPLLPKSVINKIHDNLIALQGKSQADFFMLKKEQEILNILKNGGRN